MRCIDGLLGGCPAIRDAAARQAACGSRPRQASCRLGFQAPAASWPYQQALCFSFDQLNWRNSTFAQRVEFGFTEFYFTALPTHPSSFDKFNLKYNPFGQSRLREIFIKQVRAALRCARCGRCRARCGPCSAVLCCAVLTCDAAPSCVPRVACVRRARLHALPRLQLACWRLWAQPPSRPPQSTARAY